MFQVCTFCLMLTATCFFVLLEGWCEKSKVSLYKNQNSCFLVIFMNSEPLIFEYSISLAAESHKPVFKHIPKVCYYALGIIYTPHLGMFT